MGVSFSTQTFGAVSCMCVINVTMYVVAGIDASIRHLNAINRTLTHRPYISANMYRRMLYTTEELMPNVISELNHYKSEQFYNTRIDIGSDMCDAASTMLSTCIVANMINATDMMARRDKVAWEYRSAFLHIISTYTEYAVFDKSTKPHIRRYHQLLAKECDLLKYRVTRDVGNWMYNREHA